MWIRPRGRGGSGSLHLPATLSARLGAVPAAAAASPRGGRCWGPRCAAPGARLPAAPAASAPRTAASPANERPRLEARAPPEPQAPAAGLQAPGWTKASSLGGTRKGGESAAQPLKAHRRGQEPDLTPRALSGPNHDRGGGWSLAWVQHGRGPEEIGAQALTSPLSYVLDMSCELEVGIEGVGVPSDLQFQSFPPTTPSLVSINQQMGLLELGDITHSHFHVVFISVKNPSCCSLFSARSPRMRWRCPSSDLSSEIEQQLDPQLGFSSWIGEGCKLEETQSGEATVGGHGGRTHEVRRPFPSLN